MVLSNNDGCVVSRSQEVKDLGINMAVPWFKIKDLAKRHGIVALSSNYTLYADRSGHTWIGAKAEGSFIAFASALSDTTALAKARGLRVLLQAP